MPLTMTTVTGPVYLPNGATPFGGRVSFELSSWDVEEEEGLVITGPVYVPIDENGQFSVNLFTTTAGSESVTYRMFVIWEDSILSQSYVNNIYVSAPIPHYTKKYIGSFVLSGPGPYSLSELNIVSESNNSSFDAYLEMKAFADRIDLGALDNAVEATAADRVQTGLDATAASESTAQAQAWAESATEPDGVGTKSAKTWAGEAEAQRILAETARDDAELAEIGAQAAAAQAALYDGPWLDTVAALLADTTLTYIAGQPSTVAAGDIVRTRAEGFAYQVAASGASDQHVTTAGGVKLYVLPGANGKRNIAAFGTLGATDDGAVVQAAVNVGGDLICPQGQAVNLRRTIVVDGVVSIDWNHAIVTADAAGIFDGTQPTFFHYGRATTWTGVIENGIFKITGSFSQFYYHVKRACLNYKFLRNRTEGLISTNGGSILLSEFTGIGLPAGAAFSQKNGQEMFNRIEFDPATVKLEGASSQDATENLQFRFNEIIGPGDDLFAVHGGKNIEVCDNYCETKLGRISIEWNTVQTQGIKVNRNKIVKKNANGNGGGIDMFNVGISSISQVIDVEICDNTLINDDSTYDMTYPIRARGADKIKVTGNTCINNRGAGNFILAIYRLTSAGAGSPHEITNAEIAHNRVFGGVFDYSQSGSTSSLKVRVHNNFADGEALTNYPMKLNMTAANEEQAWNNLGRGGTSGPKNLVGTGFVGDDHFATFARTAVNTGTVNLPVQGFTSAQYAYSALARQLERIQVQFSAATANGGNLDIYTYDGTTATLFGTRAIPLGATTLEITQINAGVPLQNLVIPAGHALRLEISSGAGLGSVDVVAKAFTSLPV